MNMKRRSLGIASLFFTACVFALAGCGGGGGGGGAGHPAVTSAEIGPGGGTLASADGKLKLTIPAGALGNTETITIESVDPSDLPAEFPKVGDRAYKLGPDGLQFSQPIQVSLQLDEAPVQEDGGLEGKLSLLLTSSGGVLESLQNPGMILDGTNNTTSVTGELPHFSFIELVGKTYKDSHLVPSRDGEPLSSVRVTDLPDTMKVGVDSIDAHVSVKQADQTPNTADDDHAILSLLYFKDYSAQPIYFTGVVGEADELIKLDEVGVSREEQNVGGLYDIFEFRVGFYRCSAVGNALHNPHVIYFFQTSVPSQNNETKTVTVTVDYALTYDKTPRVTCIEETSGGPPPPPPRFQVADKPVNFEGLTAAALVQRLNEGLGQVGFVIGDATALWETTRALKESGDLCLTTSLNKENLSVGVGVTYNDCKNPSFSEETITGTAKFLFQAKAGIIPSGDPFTTPSEFEMSKVEPDVSYRFFDFARSARGAIGVYREAGGYDAATNVVESFISPVNTAVVTTFSDLKFTNGVFNGTALRGIVIDSSPEHGSRTLDDYLCTQAGCPFNDSDPANGFATINLNALGLVDLNCSTHATSGNATMTGSTTNIISGTGCDTSDVSTDGGLPVSGNPPIVLLWPDTPLNVFEEFLAGGS